MHLAAAAALYGLGAYAVDVLLRPHTVAQWARRAAHSRGKPLLNVGAGTPASSVRAAVLGPQLYGDVNVDLNGSGPGSDTHVGYGDVHCLPYPDKTFGAALASHVLEHVDCPRQALRELQRVADEVYVIWPDWWAPHTWLHPGHKWYKLANGRLIRLW